MLQISGDKYCAAVRMCKHKYAGAEKYNATKVSLGCSEMREMSNVQCAMCNVQWRLE